MNCTECNKSKADLQTGDHYCQQKGCLVGQQECPEAGRRKGADSNGEINNT